MLAARRGICWRAAPPRPRTREPRRARARAWRSAPSPRPCRASRLRPRRRRWPRSREAAAPPPPPPAPPEASTPPPATAPVASPPAAARPARSLVLNFDNADVEVVIQAAAEIVGFNYVLAPGARGRKVTVQTIGKISSDEVFGVLLTILDVNGLAAVRSGNLYRIIPREGAPQTPVKTVVGREVSAAAAARRGRDADRAAAVHQRAGRGRRCSAPSSPRRAPSPPHRETNLLIVTDTAANIRRLLDMLQARGRGGGAQRAPDHRAQARRRPGSSPSCSAQLFGSGRAGATQPGAPAPPPPARARRHAGAQRRRPGSAASARDAAADRARAPLQLARRSTRASRTWRRSGG